MSEILTVSEISGMIKESLEGQFPQISVVGEISNFKAHYSGHWYFTLKDANSQINCTMWKGLNNYVFFTPQDGLKIVVNGRITVYPPRGNYQIDVRSMKPAGEGELQAAFERLKRKLSDEGLFDVEHKKPIPKFPQKIGIVTAKDGAAFRDMISVATRRYPLVELIIGSAKVQGEGAAKEIAERINEFNKRKDIDVLIIGRGGGSLEDLWAFNEEIVARAVFNSRIPVVSAVGHEVDFTISDFVADLRAPTPSAAMELATPSKDEIFAFIDEFSYNITNNIDELLTDRKEEIISILRSYGFRLPKDLIKVKSQFLDNLIYKIENNISNILSDTKSRLKLIFQIIDSADVNKTLKKGFTLVKQEGKYVKRAAKLNAAKEFKIKFYDNEHVVKGNG